MVHNISVSLAARRFYIHSFMAPTFLHSVSRGDVHAVERGQAAQVHLGRREDVRRGARGGGEAEEAAAVTRTPAFTSVAVDGSLKLTWRTETLPLTLKRVQVLHVPEERKHREEIHQITRKYIRSLRKY